MKRRRKVNKKKVILFILIIIILVIGSIFIVSKLFDKEVVPSDNIIDKDNDKEYSINMLITCHLQVISTLKLIYSKITPYQLLAHPLTF